MTNKPKTTTYRKHKMNNVSARIMGGKSTFISRDELSSIEAPSGEGRWNPISHISVVEHAVEFLNKSGMVIVEEQHAVQVNKKTGLQENYFGVLKLQSTRSDYQTAIGIRNSNAKKFAASFAIGSSVFVCDNMCFYGEAVVKARHTLNVHETLGTRIGNAVGTILDLEAEQDNEVNRLKEIDMNNAKADHLIMCAARDSIISPNRILPVSKEWREPRHDEFKPRNAWSLFNAFTEAMKPIGNQDLVNHGLDLTVSGANLHHLFAKLN